MSEFCRLVVVVDFDHGPNTNLQQSFYAHLYVELADGRRVVALDDRGWGASIGIASYKEPVTAEQRAALDIWAMQTRSDLESTARMVVGPDEPPEGMTYEEAEDHHWDYLVHLLTERGVVTDATTLRGLAMDVELSERVQARLTQ